MAFDKPRVVVVGAGAMGSLFGGLLAQGGLDVTLVDVWAEHVEAVRRHGLRIVGHGGERLIRVGATTDASTVESADVVLFQCKAFANAAAARSVLHLAKGDTLAITFQNGLGNEEALGAILGMERMIAGLTAQGATMRGPGVVHNFGDLPTYIGELAGGSSQRVVAIAEAFTRHGLRTIASENIKREKWQKLLGNASLGAASGATQMTSAEMVAVPELRGAILRALDETAAVARACGVELSDVEKRAIFDKLTRIGDGGTGASKSSIATDLEHRRPTEIDTIQGAVARLGRDNGIPTPTLDAWIAIVKGLEAKYRMPAQPAA